MGKIGNVTIGLDSSILGTVGQDRVDQLFGFYALQYKYSGRTIIAYRGTDEYVADIGGSDIVHGWPLGAGDTESAQAGLAIDFTA